MSDFRQVLVDPVCEQTACTLTLQLTDQDDVALAKAQISAVTLTLYNNRAPYTVLNSRNAQTVLDANGGTVSSTGLLTLVLGNADNALEAQTRDEEEHVALIRWTWASGTRQGAKELRYRVINQRKLT